MSFVKLPDETWGIKVTGSRPAVGDLRVVERKSDRSMQTVKIAEVVSADDEKGVYLCRIEKSARAPQRGRRACKTGGNCSSFGTGKSCGGHDCDGY